MTFFNRLVSETDAARQEFVAIPVIGRALGGDVPLWLYRDFLAEAYHHVRHTCPLLALAAARTTDAAYRNALFSYIDEEKEHDEWILDDIGALGGDAAEVKRRGGGIACRAMVAYAYWGIEHVSPYALLGMVHVLEGMSVELATRAAASLQKGLGVAGEAGFRYLRSHGTLDIEHTAFFRGLVNGIADPAAQAVIVDTANVMYRLYGNIFRELDGRRREAGLAA